MQYEIGRTSLLGNRKINQDSLASIEMEGGVMLVLGDGLGGKAGGELASQTLVETVRKEIERHPMPLPHPESFLEAVILQAHYAIQAEGKKHDPPLEPGTTAVLCLVQNGHAWWAHCGDSRFYLFRDGLPLYRTKDHSYVEQLYQKGELTVETRDGHPMRNIVTQCIGLKEVTPEVTVSNAVPLKEGDILLLCSDGLWEPLDDAQMGAVISEGPLNKSISKLAERAEEASYPKSDNTSGLAMKIFSLQLVGNKTEANPGKTRTRNENTLQGAINEIERIYEQYEDEMKK